MTHKYNKTAYNILTCLDFILNKPEFQIEELGYYLENEPEIFIDNKTIVKYIRTLKTLGFKFKKKDLYTYNLEDVPFSLTLNNSTFETFTHISSLLDKYYVYLNRFNLSLFQNKTKLFLSSELRSKLKDYFSKQKSKIKNKQLSKKLYQYCIDGQRIELTITEERNTQKILIEPLDIIIVRGNSYLKGFSLNTKSNVLINTESINSIVQIPLKNKFVYNKQYATLKFTSKLVQSYTVKTEDEILSKTQSSLTIRTTYQDKKMFFKEILKYWQYCEIVSPEFLRKDFKNFVDEIFSKYT